MKTDWPCRVVAVSAAVTGARFALRPIWFEFDSMRKVPPGNPSGVVVNVPVGATLELRTLNEAPDGGAAAGGTFTRSVPARLDPLALSTPVRIGGPEGLAANSYSSTPLAPCV